MILPVWNMAADQALEKAPKMKFAQVACDTDEGKKICDELDINHYPDMQFWK